MAHERWNDLRAFLRFVDEKLESGGESLTLDDALSLWDYETQTEEEREETIPAIQRGLDDMHAGRTVDAFEAIAELRKKHNLKAD
jgi:predicted transcriptional regulator